MRDIRPREGSGSVDTLRRVSQAPRLRLPGGEWPAGSDTRHVLLDNGDRPIVEIDIPATAAIYHGAWRDPDVTDRPVVLDFLLPSRQAVDDTYKALSAAGHLGRQEPSSALATRLYATPRQRRRPHEPHPPAPALHSHDLTVHTRRTSLLRSPGRNQSPERSGRAHPVGQGRRQNRLRELCGREGCRLQTSLDANRPKR